MPGKLMIVIGLMGLGTILNLAAGGYVSAVIDIALLLGVLAGNDGVRQFLRGLAVVQIIWAVVVVAGATAITGSPVFLIAAIIGIGSPAFFIWALGQEDVRNWMFRKNFHIDDDGAPPSL
jgi:hypothetical protein